MTRVRRNPFFERQIKASPEAQRSLEREARQVAQAVEVVAHQFEHTGDFARSISTDGNRVETTDRFAHLVEFGSANNPPYAPFRRGIRAAGLTFDDTPN